MPDSEPASAPGLAGNPVKPPPSGRKNLLLTGKPGCGKTTVIRESVENRGGAGGFFTGEIRKGGGRTGFSITTLDGRTGILAMAGAGSEPRVGRYSVNIRDLEGVAVDALERAVRDPAVRLLVIDEIAAMEIKSALFREAVIRALDGGKRVLGTIQAKRDPFLDAVRSRPDVKVVPVTAENRDVLPTTLAEWLER